MKLVLASQNEKKLKEMNDILSQLGIEVCLQSQLGVHVDVEETGETFEDNSLLKAKAVMEATGMPAIADDSGLCVDALGGAPGGVLRPVWRARPGRCGAVPPAAGEYAGPDSPYRQIRLGHHLLLPQWGRDHRPGGVPRHHRLCAPGRGRVRV